MPGQPGVAVDPAAVDPAEAAVAIKGVPDATLDRVMSGGFREVVLDQIVTRMPEFLDEQQGPAAPAHGGLPRRRPTRRRQRPGGPARRRRAPCSAERDTDGERDATLLLDGTQFLKLVLGHLNPVTAVMRGSIKVKGDVNAALSGCTRLMRIPGS